MLVDLMPSDQQLLSDYAATRREAAFAAIVERHAGLVYGAALRRTRCPSMAEDVAQMVFAVLMRKADRLRDHPCLAAWLHKTASLEAAKFMRKERAHRRKIQKLDAMTEREPAEETPHPASEHVDEAIASLSASDQRFLLMRFYQGWKLREIAATLGKSEQAARKQSERVMARLTKALARRGVAVGSASLGACLTAAFVSPCKAGLANGIGAEAAAISAGLPSTALIVNSIQTMTYGKQLGLTAAAVAALAAIPIGWQSHQIGSLKQRLNDAEQSADLEGTSLSGPSVSAVGAAETTPPDSGGAEDPVDAALSIDVATLRGATLVEVGYRAAERDLDAAMARLAGIDAAADQREFIRGVFSYAAEHLEPAKVMDLAKSLDGVFERKSALLAAVSTWTSGRAMESGVANTLIGRFGLEAGLGVALAWDEGYQVEIGEAWAEAFAETDGKAVMLGSFAAKQVLENPEAAFAMGDSLGGFDQRLFVLSLVDAWAPKDPEGAWAWAKENLDSFGVDSSGPVREVMENLARKDVEIAKAALAELEEPHHRTMAVKGIADILSYQQGTVEAVQWADALPSDAERDAAHGRIAKGSPQGIGAALALNEGFVEVTHLIANGAAERDGQLQAGDRIIEIDSGSGEFEFVYGKNDINAAVNLIRGDAGSTVRLRIVRLDDHGVPVERVIGLQREQIVMPAGKDRKVIGFPKPK